MNSAPRTVLVTGCSGGIGLATVGRLAEAGCHVFACVRRDKDADSLRDLGATVTPLILDVTDRESIDQAKHHVSAQSPEGIDALVNNAGVAIAGPVERISLEDWHKQFAVNLFGMIEMTQAFLPLLRSRGGRVVNISSAASRLALPMVAPYASSKYAVEGLSDSLRRELAPMGVKVVVVCPGQTDTPIFDKSEQATVERIEDATTEDGYDYRPRLEHFQKLMHRSASSRRSPDRVARVVCKAIQSNRPRRRYHVGLDAKAAVLVDKFVPTALVDRIIAWQTRPKATPSSK